MYFVQEAVCVCYSQANLDLSTAVRLEQNQTGKNKHFEKASRVSMHMRERGLVSARAEGYKLQPIRRRPVQRRSFSLCVVSPNPAAAEAGKSGRRCDDPSPAARGAHRGRDPDEASTTTKRRKRRRGEGRKLPKFIPSPPPSSPLSWMELLDPVPIRSPSSKKWGDPAALVPCHCFLVVQADEREGFLQSTAGNEDV